jgi:rSAM/selenodomain-associated transferase 1
VDSSHDSLLVFARAPHLGAVKTRLARDLGDERALAVYRVLAQHTVAVARASGLRVHVAFTPADAGDEMRRWLGGDLAYEPQADGDLGTRMAAGLASRFSAGARRVVIVGTDCPGITPVTIREALEALDGSDVVFGPAADGGYYLMAVHARHGAVHSRILHDVPWSSDRTLRVSLERARDAGLATALLGELRDVDTADDWRALQEGEPRR